MTSTATGRGCRNLLIGALFVMVFCFLPQAILLSSKQAVSLPVITVPPEKYLENWPTPGLSSIFVNTFLGGALMADIIVLILAIQGWRWSRGWTKQVPGRGQGMVELIVEGLWGLTKQQAGHSAKVKNQLFPIVGSLFLFLLAANWGKLIPGVESVGILHCAAYTPVAFSGLPIQDSPILGRPAFSLSNSQLLNVGTQATKESFEQCESFVSHHGADVTALDPFYDQAVTATTVEGDTLASIAAKYTADAAAKPVSDLPNVDKDPNKVLSPYIAETFDGYTSWKPVTFTGEQLLALNTGAKPAVNEEGHPVTDKLTVDTPLAPGQTINVRSELLGADATTFKNQLFTVAPFVRGAATDLNLTLSLALFSFCLIQYFGISTLGPNYFQKFINLRALGELNTRPLGAIDFVAGLFEIVSELGKIISLSFRLFGALFAGSILFAVFLFLFGSIIPAVILLLELIVGGAQAGVFAILTLIFSAQAMVSHGHDDHGHDDGEHDEVGDAHVNVYDGGHGQQAHGVSA